MSCTYIKTGQIRDLFPETESVSELTEITNGKLKDRGYVVITLDNGDKIYARTQDAGFMKQT